MADDDLSLWGSTSLGESDLVDMQRAGPQAAVAAPSDGVLAACAYQMASMRGLASGRRAFTRALLDGSARLSDATDGEDVAALRAGFEALHMAADLAGLGQPPSAVWIREVAAVLGGLGEGLGEGDGNGSDALAHDLASDRFAALPVIARAGFALHAASRASIPGDDGRLGSIVASVYLIREGGVPLFLPDDASTGYEAATAEASAGRPGALIEMIGQGRAELDRLMAGGDLGDEPAARAATEAATPAGDAVTAESVPVAVEVPEADGGDVAAVPADAPESSSTATAEPPAASPDDEGDTLPADLDISNYVGQYTFPDIHRRRIPGYIYLAVATACFALWVTTRGGDPVLVNSGFVVAAFGFLLVGWYHLATAWPLDVRDTDALVAAARVVGFPVGHASAQLGWRGLRSRPTWRILLYSSEEPPVTRGLVLVDGTDGTVLSHFTESNPEDWSKYEK